MKRTKKSGLTSRDRAALTRILEFGARTNADMQHAKHFVDRGMIVPKASGAFELTEAGAELVRSWLAKWLRRP